MVKAVRIPKLTSKRVSGLLLLKRFWYSSTSSQKTSTDEPNQRELRERAVAEALAKEEQATAKLKAIRELRSSIRESIRALDRTPSTLVQSRIQKLQEELNNLPDQNKVRQLDEELEKFITDNMKMPNYELSNRFWVNSAEILGSKGQENVVEPKKIRSTALSAYSAHFPNLRPTPDHKPYSLQELYLRQLNHARHSGSLGSLVSNVYRPRNEILNPLKENEVSVSSLLAAGCHLGHSKPAWRPSTQPFIFGEYGNIHLIDLNETMIRLKRACKVVKGVASKGGLILYVGTSRSGEQHRALEEAARRSKGYYVSKRWIPGTITNFTEVTKQVGSIDRMEIDMQDIPTKRKLSEEESEKLIKPDLVVILNPVENRNCIDECIKLRIPTIGLCDTNMEPSLLTYPIPCNDDSMRVSSLMTGVLSSSAREGLNIRYQAFNGLALDRTARK